MKLANSIVIALLLLQSPSLDLIDVQPIYVPQLTPQANPQPQSFKIASLTPAPSRPLEVAPPPETIVPVPNVPITPFNPAPVNPVEVNPVQVNPVQVNPVQVNPVQVDLAPVNPAPVNPAQVNPAPVNTAPNQPLDEFLQVPQQVPNQQCYQRQCDQIISGRNLLYSRALEIVQNEEYLTEADLNLIRRRYKRQNTPTDQGSPTIPVVSSPTFQDFPSASESFQEDTLLVSIGVGIGTVAVGALYAIPDLPLVLPGSGVPPGNPQPGTPGGGGTPNTLPQAVALVPLGLNAIAVFPPYNTPRLVPAISVIFAENPAIGNFRHISEVQIMTDDFYRTSKWPKETL